MNYYIQGDAAKADQIKAAFEKKGVRLPIRRSCADDGLIYFLLDGEVFSITIKAIELFEENPDYKELELELPKPHYDIKNFHAGMPVLVRDWDNHEWNYVLFSHCTKYSNCRFGAGSTIWRQCIPYNDDTKHLLGTTDMCPKEFINW